MVYWLGSSVITVPSFAVTVTVKFDSSARLTLNSLNRGSLSRKEEWSFVWGRLLIRISSFIALFVVFSTDRV